MRPKVSILARTAWRIGLANCLRVAVYRLKLKGGWFRRTLPIGRAIHGPFLLEAVPDEDLPRARFSLFGWYGVDLDQSMDWHASPFMPGARADDSRHWSEVPDFVPELGDIKAVWELSRFDWAPQLALAASKGDPGKAALLEALVRDWSARNPFSRGTNWKCAQEASLRLINLLFAARLLGHDAQRSTPALRRFIVEHIRRILPTVSYAIGQQNNHASSEAVGLSVGGMWLEASGDDEYRDLARRAERVGRRLFAKAVGGLVMDDGCFAQYSTNYHRLFLATAVLLDGFRRHFAKPDFDPATHNGLARATLWLHGLMEEETGRAPLLGANDGANVLNADAAPYLDMGPVVRAARRAFLGYPDGEDLTLLMPFPRLESRRFLVPTLAATAPAVASLRRGRVRCVLRLPTFRFRPSQADCLHLDVWIDGRPFLIDAGTISYADGPKNALMASIASHNTVAFDGREPMPRLSRFLFGDWVGLSSFEQGGDFLAAAYTDRWGATHRRVVRLTDDSLEIADEVSGYRLNATLAWRFAGEGVLRDGDAHADGHRLAVAADARIDLGIEQAPHGDHYLRENHATVLRARGKGVQRFTTRIFLGRAPTTAGIGGEVR